MIYANLALADTYWSVAGHPVFSRALEWIRRMPADQPTGIVHLDSKRMYVNVHGYDTLPRLECVFESHRRYVDLQYCIAGGELIDYCRTDWLTPKGAYDAERDFQFYQAFEPFSTLRMAPGDFAIFLPADGHRPKVQDGSHPAVRKLVVKIDTSLLSLP